MDKIVDNEIEADTENFNSDCRIFINQYRSEIDRFFKFYADTHSAESMKQITDSIIRIYYMALAFYGTEPGNDIEADEIILETDLHGKLSSLLVTLLETGAVKYKEGEDALVFFDSRATGDKKCVYTLAELEILRKTNATEHSDLMKKLRPVANVYPTNKYSQYVNCGDFVDRGEESESMLPQLLFLNRKCRENEIEPAKLLIGNHELLYGDRYIINLVRAKNGFSPNQHIIENLGNCVFGDFSQLRNNRNCAGFLELLEEKANFTEEIAREAIANGTLSLAHSQGTTIFAHTVVTKNIVYDIAESVEIFYEETLQKLKTASNKEKTGEFAEKLNSLKTEFAALREKIEQGQVFDENDAKRLVDALNGFSSLRAAIVSKKKLNGDLTLSAGEYKVLLIVSGFNPNGLTSNRLGELRKSDLIPGLNYVVGHDPSSKHANMEPSEKLDRKVMPIDSGRFFGASNGFIAWANYGIAKRADFNGPNLKKPAKVINKQITKDEIIPAVLANYVACKRQKSIAEAAVSASSETVAKVADANSSTVPSRKPTKQSGRECFQQRKLTGLGKKHKLYKIRSKKLKSLMDKGKNRRQLYMRYTQKPTGFTEKRKNKKRLSSGKCFSMSYEN